MLDVFLGLTFCAHLAAPPEVRYARPLLDHNATLKGPTLDHRFAWVIAVSGWLYAMTESDSTLVLFDSRVGKYQAYYTGSIHNDQLQDLYLSAVLTRRGYIVATPARVNQALFVSTDASGLNWHEGPTLDNTRVNYRTSVVTDEDVVYGCPYDEKDGRIFRADVNGLVQVTVDTPTNVIDMDQSPPGDTARRMFRWAVVKGNGVVCAPDSAGYLLQIEKTSAGDTYRRYTFGNTMSQSKSWIPAVVGDALWLLPALGTGDILRVEWPGQGALSLHPKLINVGESRCQGCRDSLALFGQLCVTHGGYIVGVPSEADYVLVVNWDTLTHKYTTHHHYLEASVFIRSHLRRTVLRREQRE
eukprot:Hpha_TRINITY_DN11112_c0_g2::TRINITY_DN11112_c0_g2_i1::g.28088::m.28088